MNDETIFDKFERWKKLTNEGRPQVQIATYENIDKSYVSQVVKHFGKLSQREITHYKQMFDDGEITQGAILDLIKPDDLETRRKVEEGARRICNARDVAAEEARRLRKKGRFTEKGKITAKEVRSAIQEVKRQESNTDLLDASR
jgi:hypothetical protein